MPFISNQININHNLIALQLIHKNEPTLVIMNHELEVIKQIPIDTGSIKGSDKSFIYNLLIFIEFLFQY